MKISTSLGFALFLLIAMSCHQKTTKCVPPPPVAIANVPLPTIHVGDTFVVSKRIPGAGMPDSVFYKKVH